MPLWFAELMLARDYRDRDLDLDRTLGRTLGRALDLTRDGALDLDLALILARDLDRDLDLALALTFARDLDQLRRTQFDFRARLINYLKPTVPAVRSRFRSDLQFLIEHLQLLNDRLEGKAEPVEAIALVRREGARK
jgi:hypothetical protein